MLSTNPFIVELKQHTRLRADDGVRFATLVCAMRRTDGVPAFLS